MTISYFSVLDCGEPPSLNNTQRTLVNGTVYSSLVMYNCTEEGQVLDDKLLLRETYTVCTEHGSWSRNINSSEGCHGMKTITQKTLLNHCSANVGSVSQPTIGSRVFRVDCILICLSGVLIM